MHRRIFSLFAAGTMAALFAGCRPDPAPTMVFPPGTEIPKESTAKGGKTNPNQSSGDPSAFSRENK